jgi:hypothetical protein
VDRNRRIHPRQGPAGPSSPRPRGQLKLRRTTRAVGTRLLQVRSRGQARTYMGRRRTLAAPAVGGCSGRMPASTRCGPGPGTSATPTTVSPGAARCGGWVQARTVGIPVLPRQDQADAGAAAPAPRHRARVWFHNPASLPCLGSQRRHRQEALHRQATLANRLRQDG